MSGPEPPAGRSGAGGKDACPRCGAAMFATDPVCLSCGAEREYARPGSPRSPGAGVGNASPLPADAAPAETPAVATEPGPRPRLGELSSYIVERCGIWWGMMGWLFFLLWFVGPIVFLGAPAVFFWACFALTVIWWNLDVNDQQLPGWQIALGLVMLGIGFLPRGGFLTLAAWIIYWTRVRE